MCDFNSFLVTSFSVSLSHSISFAKAFVSFITNNRQTATYANQSNGVRKIQIQNKKAIQLVCVCVREKNVRRNKQSN